MIAGVPSFAVVGAVNHGKSSVVSTLAEDDRVQISPMPGETVECRRFSLRDLFVFYDTPGFQNAFEALTELRPAAQGSDPLADFRSFLARHRGAPAAVDGQRCPRGAERKRDRGGSSRDELRPRVGDAACGTARAHAQADRSPAARAVRAQARG